MIYLPESHSEIGGDWGPGSVNCLYINHSCHNEIGLVFIHRCLSRCRPGHQADRSHYRLDLLAFADRSLLAEPSGMPRHSPWGPPREIAFS